MNLDRVLIGPILSEKTATLRERKVFCFQIHPRANKVEVLAAVKEYFNVVPIKCRTMIIKPKPKRLRNVAGKTSRVKKHTYILNRRITSLPLRELDEGVVYGCSRK